jgi:hypothetical protein
MADVTTILNEFYSHKTPIPLGAKCIHYGVVLMKEENFVLRIHNGTTKDNFHSKTAKYTKKIS